MATPDLHDWLGEHGAEPISMSQSEFADFVRGEIDSASRIADGARLFTGEAISNRDADVIAEIKRQEAELARAVVTRDYEMLRRIEADTYVYTDADAHVNTRDEFIEAYRSGKSRISVLRFSHVTVQLYADAAVVRGILTVEREDNGRHLSRRSRYTRLYIRFTDGWKAVAGHSSAIAGGVPKSVR